MIKRLLIAFFIVFLVLAAGVGTLPWWLGAALRGPAAARGLTYANYEKVSYGRWALNGVVFERDGVRVEADRVEGPQVLRWWRNRCEAGPVLANNVRVTVARTPASEDKSGSEWSTSFRPLLKLWDQLRPEVPPVTIEGATVNWGGAHSVTAGRVAADLAGHFAIEQGRYREIRFDGAADLKSVIAATGREVWSLQAEDTEHGVQVTGTATGAGRLVNLTGAWREQRFQLSAGFKNEHWIPDTGRIAGDQWALPVEQIGLGNLGGTVHGGFAAEWIDGHLGDVSANLVSDPGAEGKAPAITVSLVAHGEAQALEVNRLQVELPGLQLNLDQPIRIACDHWREAPTSTFDLQAHLDQLPWGDAWAGQVRGKVLVRPQPETWPQIEADLGAEDLNLRGQQISRLEAKGTLAWPHWSVTELLVVDEHGGSLQATGEGNAQDRTVAQSEFDVATGPELFAPWLPDGLTWERIQIAGTAAGGWRDPQIGATGVVTRLQLPEVKPLSAEFDVERGEHGNRWKLRAQPENTAEGEVAVSGAGSWSEATLGIETFVVTEGDHSLVQLRQPMELNWTDGWRIGPMALSGAIGQVRVDAVSANQGQVHYEGTDPDFVWLEAWLANPPQHWVELEQVKVDLDWSGDAVKLATAAQGGVDWPELGRLTFDWDILADSAQTRVNRLVVGQGDRTFAQISGALPIAWQLHGPKRVTIDPEGAIELTTTISPNPAFWQAWGKVSGVTISRPDIRLNLGGTWRQPTGEGQIALALLTVDPRWGGVTWPEVRNVQSHLIGGKEGLRVDALSAEVDGHVLRASGTLPLRPEDWSALQEDPLGYLRAKGEASLEVPEADLASVARLLPDYLVPTGTLGLKLQFGGGGEIDGSVRLRNAVTRPIGPLGVLQDVNADLSFSGRNIRLESVEATMGGQPLALDGSVDWPAGAEPRLDLHLQGTDVPLVRSTGLLMRGDLDLGLRTDSGGDTTVSGKVRLRDGLMLADVRSFVPSGGTGRQSRRPPYFSVEIAPFRDWRLDVAVEGRRFLRLRTPVMNGVASIDAHLEGTLLNPRARGEVTLDEGVVKLPFANFKIEEGYARLTSASPYEPEIFLRGEGRRLGYDLGLELSGTASDPRLEMSSDPALPASDVLLFVMAGVPPDEDNTGAEAGQRGLQLGVYLGRELVGDLLGFEPSDRLTISTGEQLSRRGRETYRVEYELNDRWTLSGEYDEFDYYNTGLRWRWYPWKRDEAANGDEEDNP